MWGRSVLLVSFALVALGTAKCPRRKTSPVREILCYTSISDAQILAGSVCSCTTLVHQNHDVRNVSISDISDLRKSLKEMHPSLQFAISIHDPAMTLRNSAMVRQEAIARIIAVMKEVDGVEMNVTAGSKERLYNFIKSLKDEMIRKSYDKRIFIALPTRSEDLAKQFDIKELIKYIDLFTLPTDYMTDEDGAFVTFHPSRLMGLFDMLNTDSLVDLISGLGAPKQKIMMTLPASAYKFTLKNEDENAPRSETTEKEPVPIDRKQLCEAMNSGEWTVERDEDLTAPYAFQNKTWIAFEDKISVGIKGKYALLRDLAGLAVRNIENDVETECEEPLSQEIYHSFTEFRRKSRQAVLNALEDELHQMQFSYPNHAKTSSFRVVRVVDTEGHIRAVRESTQTEFVCRRQGYFVHPKSCNRFYRCVKFNQGIEDYSVFEFDCPAGLSFDERTEVCVWPGSLPEGSPCPGSSEIAPVAPKRFECSQPGYYADPQNCRWFFACMDLGGAELMAFEFRCPYGLVFDEKKLVCEWPWLVPACSESGSGYARTEYNYGGYTAGASTGDGAGGYVTSGLPEYSVTAGRDHSNVDYSRTTDTYGTNYFGSTAGNIGKPGISVPGDGGLSGSARVDYSKSDEYEGTVSSVPAYNNIQTGSVPPNTIVGEGGTGYSASSGRIGGGGYGVSTGQGGAGYSGGFNTGFAHTGSSGGVTAGFGNKGSSGGVTAGFENTGGFSGATTDTYGTNYFGSTAGNIGKPGISVPGDGGLSGSARVDYSKSDEYGGTVSSVPAYNNIQTGSVPPNTIVGEGGTGYSASSGRIGGSGYGVSTGQGAGYSGGFNTGFAHTGSSGGVTAGFGNKGSSGGVTAGFENTGGFSGATAGEYSGTASGTHLTEQGETYSGGSTSSYPSLGGYVGSTTSSIDITDYSRIPGGVGLSGSSIDIHVESTSPKYGQTNIHAGSSAFNADDYSSSTGVYSGVTGERQPSFGQTGPSVSHPGATGNIEITGTTNRESTATAFRKSTDAGYSKATGGISSTESNVHQFTGSGVGFNPYSTTASGRVPGADFTYGVPKSELGTSGISTVSGHVGITSRPTGPSSTGYKYNEDGGYTVPVFIQHDEPIYPSAPTGTTGTLGVHLPTGKATFNFQDGRTNFARPNLNVSIYGNEIPTGYDDQKGITGTIQTGSSIDGNIITGDSFSGNVFGHGNVPGAVSTPAINQGTIIAGEVQPGYVATSSGTPGYVIGDGVKTAAPDDRFTAQSVTPGYSYPKPTVGFGSVGPGILYGTPSPGGPIQITYHGGAPATGSIPYSSTPSEGLISTTPQGYKTDNRPETHFISYKTDKHTEKDIPDYRPTSAILPDSNVPGIAGGAFGPTFQGSTTAAPGYSPSKSAVFTTSEFTKTGPTRTGITTAVLGGGGSYSISPGERRPAYSPDNISEKAFEGNVAGYTSSTDSSSVTLIPPGYSSTPAPGSGISVQSPTSGYSYSRPTGQFGTSGVPFSSTAAPGGGISVQLPTSGYSYSRPTGQFGTSGAPFSSTPAPGGGISVQSPTSGYSYPRLTGQFGTSGAPFSSTAAPGGGISVQLPTSGYSYSRPTGQFGTSGAPFSSTAAPSGGISVQLPTSGYSYSRPTGQFGTSGAPFSSTAAPGGSISVQSPTSGYSYPRPTGQFGTSGVPFSSTPAPGDRVTVQPATSGYSYSKPTVQFGTSRAPFFSTSIGSNLPVTTPTPFFSRLPTSTVSPVIYTTEHPEIYQSTIFESKKIPGAIPTDKPISNTVYKISSPLIDDQFTQRTGGPQTATVSPTSFDLELPFQQTDSSGQTGYGSSLGYLPAKSTPGVIASTTKYEGSTPRPDFIGVTYKKPSPIDVSYGGPSSFQTPTTYRPPNYYDQGFSTTPSSLETTPGGGSPTNLDISRHKIDQLITNYDRGTVKYTPPLHDTYPSSGFGSTRKFISSSTQSSFSTKFGSGFTTPSGIRPSTLSYEVTTKSPEGKGKVIVKWSDLHPLLLGKLGAECTCKADPFANIRGPAKQLIQSSKGKVDLANYDSSEIYVDLGSSEEGDYSTNSDNLPAQPFKISVPETSDSIKPPSSAYLPAIDGRISAKNNELRSGRRGKKLEYEEEVEEEEEKDEYNYDDDPDQIINGVSDCARPGLFRHPGLCNKFYACHWDQWKKKFTLHIFNCPVHLTFDSHAGACNWPSKGPACQADNLLV